MRLGKTRRPARQLTVCIECKRAAFKHHFILTAHQVRIHQGQACGFYAQAHGLFALITFAHMKGRRVDDGQQFGTGVFGVFGGGVKPSVFANEQAHAHALHFKHAGLVAGCEVAAFVKHLVVGQFALGVLRHHLTFADHAGEVVAPLHRDRTAALVTARGVADHHMQAF